jgi:predicted Fe-Mo cluster-binding NifX family protein
MRSKKMKIAIITEDGNTVSQHFGRAPYYKVVTIENGQILGSEMREKLGHNHFSGEHLEEHHTEPHGLDEAHHDRHAQMAGSISDCEAVVCGGMGMGAYQSMVRLGIKPVVTDLSDINLIIQAYVDGKLTDHTEKLH